MRQLFFKQINRVRFVGAKNFLGSLDAVALAFPDLFFRIARPHEKHGLALRSENQERLRLIENRLSSNSCSLGETDDEHPGCAKPPRPEGKIKVAPGCFFIRASRRFLK